MCEQVTSEPDCREGKIKDARLEEADEVYLFISSLGTYRIFDNEWWI